MKKGGYQIIDLESRNLLDDDGVVYDGIYDTIKSTPKTYLISGLTIEDIDYNDEFATPTLDGSNYVFHLLNNTITITVTSNDVVTATLN